MEQKELTYVPQSAKAAFWQSHFCEVSGSFLQVHWLLFQGRSLQSHCFFFFPVPLSSYRHSGVVLCIWICHSCLLISKILAGLNGMKKKHFPSEDLFYATWNQHLSLQKRSCCSFWLVSWDSLNSKVTWAKTENRKRSCIFMTDWMKAGVCIILSQFPKDNAKPSVIFCSLLN